MKNLTLIAVILLSFNLAFDAQSQSNELEPGYYLVVGSYAPSRENIAQNYVEMLTRKGIEASYGFNTSNNQYLVYLNYHITLQASLKSMQKVRRQPEFQNAWIRVVAGDIVKKEDTSSEIRQEVVVKPVIPSATVIEEKQIQVAVTKNDPSNETSKPSQQPVLLASASEELMISDNPEIIQYKKMTLGNTEVFLSLYNAINNRIVEGKITVIDTDRSKVIKEVKGNEYLILPDPKNTSGKITLICEAFGYKKISHDLNYKSPLADTVKEYVDLMGTTIVVNFDLQRYGNGDLATLSDVSFYNDAAVMLPESKVELDNLIHMMDENPQYRIRLHGHSNGNYNGKIISLGPDKNFFSLNGSVQGIGTSKELSEKRAQSIKDYLVANGIDETRIEVKSWGGKKPLYDKHSVNAKYNVRVEVEVLNK